MRAGAHELAEGTGSSRGRLGRRVARRVAGCRGGGRRGPPEGRASGPKANAGSARIRGLSGRRCEPCDQSRPRRACGAGDGQNAHLRARSEPGALPGQLPAASRGRGGPRRIGATGYGSRAARPAGRPSADPAARTRAPIGRDAGAAAAALRHEGVDAPRPRGLILAPPLPPSPKQERRLKKTYYDGLGRKDPSKNDD